MGRADYLDLGNWNAACDRCGKKFKASMLRKDWQGLMVCHSDWEPRQPQDFAKGVPDIQTPPWTRPLPAPVYTVYCTPDGSTAIVGLAVVGCVKVSYISPARTFDPRNS